MLDKKARTDASEEAESLSFEELKIKYLVEELNIHKDHIEEATYNLLDFFESLYKISTKDEKVC